MSWFGWVPQRPVCAQCHCHREVQQRGDSEEEKTQGWRTSGVITKQFPKAELQVTKKSQCDKTMHQIPRLELLPHRNPTLPWEEAILPQGFYVFQVQAGWRALLQAALAQRVAKSCGVIMEQLLEGGMPAPTHVDTNTTGGCSVHISTHVPVCVLHLLTQHTSTFCTKTKLPSAGFMSKPPRLHHLPGLWLRKKGHVPFLFLLLSSFSIPR